MIARRARVSEKNLCSCASMRWLGWTSTTTSGIISFMNRLQADLLVLGGGMAGLSAAASAVRDGLSVVLVEKGELGGSAARAGFIWTAPSIEALREAIPDGDPQLAARLIEGFGPA